MDYLSDERLSRTQKRELAETIPKENHRRSTTVTVEMDIGGSRNKEDALWSERSEIVPFSDGVFDTYKVEIQPGDHFLIREREYVFKGVNGSARSKMLFRPLDEDGEETMYTTSSPYKQINKEKFAKAFGSGDDIHFRCERIDPNTVPKRTARFVGRVVNRVLEKV